MSSVTLTIDGREVTLDGIEHRTLRPLGDPRIHGAIVCASLSCPPLRQEPYREERLDAQLDDNVRRWLADLVELEHLGVAEEGRQGAGKTTRYRLLDRGPRRDAVLGLLSPEQLRGALA